jgi:Ran GTPase-activating protein (RanGAP) involved in mRNA processing and transport
LTSLDVSCNATNGKAVVALTAALQNSPSMTRVDLSHLALGNHPGPLADMVRDAPVLTHLSLASNGLKAGGGSSRHRTMAKSSLRYGDEKVANRDTKVWHGATEKGP